MKKLFAMMFILCIAFSAGIGQAEEAQVIGEGNMLPINESSMQGEIEIQISNPACEQRYGCFYADQYHKAFSFECLIRNWSMDDLEISTDNWYLEYQRHYDYRQHFYDADSFYGRKFTKILGDGSNWDQLPALNSGTMQLLRKEWDNSKNETTGDAQADILMKHNYDPSNGSFSASASEKKRTWWNYINFLNGIYIVSIHNGDNWITISEEWSNGNTFDDRDWYGTNSVPTSRQDKLGMLEEMEGTFIFQIPNQVAEHAFDGELVLHMFINEEEYQVCFNMP